MVKFRILFLLVTLSCALCLPGCSTGPITITLSPSTPPVINAGASQDITATLTNDKNHEGVTWSLTGPGNLTNQTTTSVTYVAPIGISIEATGTITATSVATTTVTATLNVTVNPVLQISTNSLPVGNVGVSYDGVIGAIGATGTFTWTITSGKLPAGLSLSSSTSSSVTILGIPTTVGTSSFTIQVVDSAGDSVSKTLGITINPPPPLSVATHFLPDGVVGIAYTQALSATSGTPPYTWSLAAGSNPLPAGNPAFQLSTAGVITGTPTTVNTYPFTVEVMDSSSPQQTAQATLSITIDPSSAGNVQLDGTYAFLVSGFSGSHNSVAAGSFTADGNGNVLSGFMDSNSNSSTPPQTNAPITGTYIIGSSGLGTMTLNVAGGGSSTFALTTKADGSGGQIIEFGSTTAAGALVKQSPPFSNINGDFALGFLGVDATANRYGFAGTFEANGTGGFTAPGTLDSDDAVSGPSSSVSFTGTYSVPTTANGRGTMILNIGSQAPTNYCYYMVSSGQALVMETDNVSGTGEPLVSGSMLQQSGPFSNSSLNGTSVLETTALSGSSPVAQVGLLTTTSGSSTLGGFENSGGAISPTTGNGSYNVLANGRVNFTSASGIATPDPILYLVSSNQAFIVGTDSAVTFGYMADQPNPGSFGASSLSGNYAGGLLAPVQSSDAEQVDVADADGVSNVTFTTDVTSGGGLQQGQSSSATYSLLGTGSGTLTENSTTAGYFFMVSPTEFYELFAGSNVTIEHFEQ